MVRHGDGQDLHETCQGSAERCNTTHEVSEMKFDQKWWDECPLGMNPFAQTLRTAFSNLGKETVLEAWPASSSTFDEFNSPEDICCGFPRVKKIGTSFDDFDTFYILRIGKHNCLPLGFESEIFTSQLWWHYSESDVDSGVKVFMMRYITELIYLRYDDKREELE